MTPCHMTACHVHIFSTAQEGGESRTMPKSTFYNLPQAKKDMILVAAKKEFSRVPFNEISINKIIQDADIPRGSFYMYFEDKKDLAYWLFNEYSLKMTDVFNESLKNSNGDIFALFIALYDSTFKYGSNSNYDLKLFKNLFTSMHSFGLHVDDGINMRDILALNGKMIDLKEVMKTLNFKNLTIKTPEEIEDLLLILFCVTKHSIAGAFSRTDDFPVSRERFIRRIDMIKYGILKD